MTQEEWALIYLIFPPLVVYKIKIFFQEPTDNISPLGEKSREFRVSVWS